MNLRSSLRVNRQGLFVHNMTTCLPILPQKQEYGQEMLKCLVFSLSICYNMGATHLNILAMLGAFYIGKNATSYFRTYMASEKMCRSIRGHAFFGAWLRLRTFLLPKKCVNHQSI